MGRGCGGSRGFGPGMGHYCICPCPTPVAGFSGPLRQQLGALLCHCPQGALETAYFPKSRPLVLEFAGVNLNLETVMGKDTGYELMRKGLLKEPAPVISPPSSAQTLAGMLCERGCGWMGTQGSGC